MKACIAYYTNGQFIPLGFGKLPEGTLAIITLLDEAPIEVNERLSDFESLLDDIHAAEDEEMPELERIEFREVSL